MKSEIVKLGKLEIDLQELAEFIVWAKKQGYAGGGKYRKMVDDSKQFSCQRGNFHFGDEYMGELQFSGHEIVRWKTKSGQLIWRMNYFGGVLPEFLEDKKIVKRVDDFLRLTLIQVTPESPFRGPKYFDNLKDFYINDVKGDVRRFFGKEEIHLKKAKKEEWKNGGSSFIAYTLNYHGGIIIPK